MQAPPLPTSLPTLLTTTLATTQSCNNIHLRLAHNSINPISQPPLFTCAWPAWPLVPHLPKVVLAAKGEHTVLWQELQNKGGVVN